MLDFRSRRRAPHFGGAKEQRHLLLLVLALGATLIAIAEASRGDRWGWFGRASAQPIEADDAPTSAQQAVPARQTLPGLDLKALETVRDDTPIRNEDHPAFYQLLATLRDTSSDAIRKASTGLLSYRQVYHQPRQYRGETMKVYGVVRRAFKLDAPASESASGIASYWQLWLFPADGDEPLVIYALDVPAEFPQGMEISEQVELYGVFFKRWVYTAQERVRSAPLLAAKSISWTPPPPADEQGPAKGTSLKDFLYSALGTIVLSAAVIAYVIWRTEKLRKKPRSLVRGIDPQASRDGELATRRYLGGLEESPTVELAPGEIVLEDGPQEGDDAPASPSSGEPREGPA